MLYTTDFSSIDLNFFDAPFVAASTSCFSNGTDLEMIFHPTLDISKESSSGCLLRSKQYFYGNFDLIVDFDYIAGDLPEFQAIKFGIHIHNSLGRASCGGSALHTGPGGHFVLETIQKDKDNISYDARYYKALHDYNRYKFVFNFPPNPRRFRISRNDITWNYYYWNSNTISWILLLSVIESLLGFAPDEPLFLHLAICARNYTRYHPILSENKGIFKNLELTADFISGQGGSNIILNEDALPTFDLVPVSEHIDFTWQGKMPFYSFTDNFDIFSQFWTIQKTKNNHLDPYLQCGNLVFQSNPTEIGFADLRLRSQKIKGDFDVILDISYLIVDSGYLDVMNRMGIYVDAILRDDPYVYRRLAEISISRYSDMALQVRVVVDLDLSTFFITYSDEFENLKLRIIRHGNNFNFYLWKSAIKGWEFLISFIQSQFIDNEVYISIFDEYGSTILPSGIRRFHINTVRFIADYIAGFDTTLSLPLPPSLPTILPTPPKENLKLYELVLDTSKSDNFLRKLCSTLVDEHVYDTSNRSIPFCPDLPYSFQAYCSEITIVKVFVNLQVAKEIILTKSGFFNFDLKLNAGANEIWLEAMISGQLVRTPSAFYNCYNIHLLLASYAKEFEKLQNTYEQVHINNDAKSSNIEIAALKQNFLSMFLMNQTLGYTRSALQQLIYNLILAFKNSLSRQALYHLEQGFDVTDAYDYFLFEYNRINLLELFASKNWINAPIQLVSNLDYKITKTDFLYINKKYKYLKAGIYTIPALLEEYFVYAYIDSELEFDNVNNEILKIKYSINTFPTSIKVSINADTNWDEMKLVSETGSFDSVAWLPITTYFDWNLQEGQQSEVLKIKFRNSVTLEESVEERRIAEYFILAKFYSNGLKITNFVLTSRINSDYMYLKEMEQLGFVVKFNNTMDYERRLEITSFIKKLKPAYTKGYVIFKDMLPTPYIV